MVSFFDALVEHHHGFEHVRRQRAVDQKARRALHRRRQPVDAAEERARRRPARRRDLVVADHLDELHARHRIEEVHADQPLRPLQARRATASSGMLDVLVARIASGFIFGSIAGKDLRLSSSFSGTASMIRSAVRNALALEIGDQPVERVAHVDGCRRADLAVKLGGALDRAAERLRLHVGEADGEAMPRAPGGDVAAHGAGADHMHARARPLAVGQALELFAQEEHAHQISARFA